VSVDVTERGWWFQRLSLSRTAIVHGGVICDDDCRFNRLGAVGLQAPTDEPYGRSYTSADCEGHRWRFMNAG
jgi:hypothetical protein